MCCEEHHICKHCNQIITSTTDRCFAWRAGCADGDHRNPGTEFGSGDRCFCPDGEEIVEEFYHDDDGFYCPNCSSAPHHPQLSSSGRYRNDRPRPPPIDPVSGEEVVAVAAVDDSPTSCSDGTYSASSDEGAGAAAAATTPTTPNASNKGAGSWRMRVRKIVSGTTRLAGAGKRREDDDIDQPAAAVLRDHELRPSSADKRGTKATVTSAASVNGDGGAAEQNGPSSLL
ncbi:hypothetical protein BFW01_g1163 [Lasiodiplodia theobromae]|uniref:Uncharacterized protein n=1 Tax=Lasiodiplodia theobromae TaxID=45133 RepID=A0A5N5DMY3_9PEZI|nr:uncharacterized protein LTHEOB_4455 [Lasiodiplodia theobromae]KAB2578960.1 hypothetical protein DBV05_g2401 [Lasiodiplodia theobromae]KAF4546458.1 hypothetical protein LTHEOB_4455 [Lasiodiplodia theobromae]KAF9630601.1 hypothetical protein BFW01_g1163 [Lasiodiplodia theobromae]